MSLKAARDAYARAMPPGELLLFRDDAIDRVGIPVVASSLRMRGGPWITSHGYGATEEEGMVSAIGELAEEVYAEKALTSLPRFHGSYTELVCARGASGVPCRTPSSTRLGPRHPAREALSLHPGCLVASLPRGAGALTLSGRR